LFHLSAGGQTSWWGFACKVLQLAGLTTPVTPITTDEYPTPTRRPKYSVLDGESFSQATGFRIGSWESRLAACMQQAGLAMARG
jgi:dTDP-4-dehydrorhamnose reductase